MEQMLKEILKKINSMDKKINSMNIELKEVKSDVKAIKETQNAILNQTAILTEFKTNTQNQLDTLTKGQRIIFEDLNKFELEQKRTNELLVSINEIIGDHEVNFRTLKTKKIL